MDLPDSTVPEHPAQFSEHESMLKYVRAWAFVLQNVSYVPACRYMVIRLTHIRTRSSILLAYVH